MRIAYLQNLENSRDFKGSLLTKGHFPPGATSLSLVGLFLHVPNFFLRLHFIAFSLLKESTRYMFVVEETGKPFPRWSPEAAWGRRSGKSPRPLGILRHRRPAWLDCTGQLPTATACDSTFKVALQHNETSQHGGVNDFKEQPARFPHPAEEVIDTHKTPEPQWLRSWFLSASKTIASLLEYDGNFSNKHQAGTKCHGWSDCFSLCNYQRCLLRLGPRQHGFLQIGAVFPDYQGHTSWRVRHI